MDKRSVPNAHHAHAHHDDDVDERRPCFHCLGGYVFIGSVDHDGDEIIESVRCRRCGGSGVLAEQA